MTVEEPGTRVPGSFVSGPDPGGAGSTGDAPVRWRMHGQPGVGITDFHNHVIPGVDDGARDEAETVSALEAMAAEGVSALIATPHVRLFPPAVGSIEARLAELDEGWERLLACAGDMPVKRGAELRLDTADPGLDDARLRLGGGRFALVEYPFFSVPPRSARVLALIVSRGWIPIVAHPERYSGIETGLDTVREWRETGALVQVNIGSLLGRFGRPARRTAHALLARGWVDYLGSDYHARGAPRIAEGRALLERSGATAQAELLLVTNPGRLWRDEMPLPVLPAAMPDPEP
jgi:protein-tyrosine phosphatase